MTRYNYYVEAFTLPHGDFAQPPLIYGHRIHTVLDTEFTAGGVKLTVLVEAPHPGDLVETRN